LGAVFRHKRILPLPAFKRDDRNALALSERMDAGDEVIVSWLDQGGRRYRVAENVMKEVAQAAGCLELGHVGMQVEPVDTAHRERDVLADNVRDVGRHRTLRGGKVDDGTPCGGHRPARSQHHPSFQ
jgi:hypothetical protein